MYHAGSKFTYNPGSSVVFNCQGRRESFLKISILNSTVSDLFSDLIQDYLPQNTSRPPPPESWESVSFIPLYNCSSPMTWVLQSF